MAREVVTSCDQCGSAEEVATFEVTFEGNRWEVDLCVRHRGPLDKVLLKARPVIGDASPAVQQYERLIRT